MRMHRLRVTPLSSYETGQLCTTNDPFKSRWRTLCNVRLMWGIFKWNPLKFHIPLAWLLFGIQLKPKVRTS